MTREKILEKVRFVGELRGLAATTLNNYYLYIRQYQNYYGKPADELTVREVHLDGQKNHPQPSLYPTFSVQI